MIENNIDVAKIMREIRASVMEKKFEHGIDEELLNIRKDMSCFSDELVLNRKNIETYLVMGMRIPKFSRFPSILRPILIIITRLVRKVTLYMTREQTIVNKGLYQLIGDLLKQNDNNQKLTFIILQLYRENKEMKEQLNKYQLIVEELKRN